MLVDASADIYRNISETLSALQMSEDFFFASRPDGKGSRVDTLPGGAKITMGMDMLSCRTPDMIFKEVCVYFLAYNLIRLLMTQAGKAHSLTPRHISFKHTIRFKG